MATAPERDPESAKECPGGAGDKKLVPLDATSEEEAAAFMALVAELQSSQSFHPVVEVGRALWEESGHFLKGLLLPGGAYWLAAGLLELLPLTEKQAASVLLPFFLCMVLPLWGVLLVGSQRDRLQFGAYPSLGEGLDRWKHRMMGFLPLLLVYLAGVRVLGGPRSGLLLYVSYPLVSLLWGYVVCEAVLGGLSLGPALLRGSTRALSDLVRLPARVLGWLVSPRLQTLTAGPLPLLPYFALIWLTPVMLVLVWGMTGLGLLTELGLSMRVAEVLSVPLVMALGFGLPVRLSANNYMACLAEEHRGSARSARLALDSGLQ